MLKADDALKRFFIEDARGTLNDLQSEIEGGSWPPSAVRAASWHRSIHTIKGNASFFAWPELEAHCRGIEGLLTLLRTADHDSLKTSPAELLAILEELIDTLEGLAGKEGADNPGGSGQDENRTSFEELVAGLPALADRLAASCGKMLTLRIEQPGEALSLPQRIHSALHAALVQILRNAIDHGIEPPQERKERGKARAGSITISCERSGLSALIHVEDDGAGLDPHSLAKSAGERGPRSKDDDTGSGSTALEIIFEHGFSAARTDAVLSGCGVGLDIVRHRLREQGGEVLVRSETGKGCCFTLRVPLS